VDADYFDTARHYGHENEFKPIPTKWTERIDALDKYIAELPEGNSERERKRNGLRKAFYDACKTTPVDSSLFACDAPVGTGKTTAVMAHLLRVAKENGLRHIFVVLPYTNIIKQSVEIYRKALVLPGENPEEIIAEHHHQADFRDIELRGLATLWKSPIIVTTAVQFFETLAACHPARLRKLHQLPGSAIFIDESHAAVPIHLWPQVWEWLNVFTKEWSGSVVFASGSLHRFWKIENFIASENKIIELISDSDLAEKMRSQEKTRMIPRREIQPFTGDFFIDWLTKKEGPRLVVMNTVQSAAVLAAHMRQKGHDVIHLSTALAPLHRDRIVERIKERLKYKLNNWTLVATSCVEAGLDFSFRTGFRESCSATSLLQIGGRINRNNEYGTAEIWDFRIVDPPLYNENPSFALSRKVLDTLFDEDAFSSFSIEDILRKALSHEITESKNEKAKEILKMEKEMEYPQVERLCRVIDSDTRTVLIDKTLADRITTGKEVSPNELQRYCVQIWASKISALNVKRLFESCEDEYGLYVWEDDYDPDFLGYMQGVLKLKEFIISGGTVI
jgi:CRISPR-associated endonuclease/helicase Cas3